jgi:hypothetical protein
MSLSDQQDSPNLEDLTPEEANRIIHSHRKVRYGQSHPYPNARLPSHMLLCPSPFVPSLSWSCAPAGTDTLHVVVTPYPSCFPPSCQLHSLIHIAGTACWPCRQRKVKCDNKSPCENCVKREHPQLCSYKPNRAPTHPTLKNGSVVSEPTQGLKRQHSPDSGHHRRSQSAEARPEPNIRAYGMCTSRLFVWNCLSL